MTLEERLSLVLEQIGADIKAINNTRWSLLGNTGTNPANHFIGTTDNQPLVFRTNNSERLRILSNGNVGIGTTVDAGFRLDINGTTRATSLTFTDGTQGLLFGNLSLLRVDGAITSSENISLGRGASATDGGGTGSSLSIGNFSSATGASLAFGITANAGNSGVLDSIAIGRNALIDANVIRGVAIGRNANAKHGNAWAVGYNAVTYMANSFTFGDSSITSIFQGNVLIGTTTNAGYKLDVNGSVRSQLNATSTSTNAFTFIHQTPHVGWNQVPSFLIQRQYDVTGASYQLRGVFEVNEINNVSGWSCLSKFTSRGIGIYSISGGTVGANTAAGYRQYNFFAEGSPSAMIGGVLSNSSPYLYLFSVSNTANASRIMLHKNRGTGAASSLPNIGDEYGGISFGTDSTVNGGAHQLNSNIAAQIISRATVIPSGTNIGGNFIFQVKNNSSTFIDAMIIQSNGSVGIGSITGVASSILTLSSTNQGFLPPRMTTEQRDAIVSPATGLVLFNTTTDTLQVRASTGWINL
jgi:hypothetical protein